jgi:hypothetical protein
MGVELTLISSSDSLFTSIIVFRNFAAISTSSGLGISIAKVKPYPPATYVVVERLSIELPATVARGTYLHR